MTEYEAGRRDGKIDSLERMLEVHTDQLESHNSRISTLERVSYIVFGIVLTLQFGPAIISAATKMVGS